MSDVIFTPLPGDIVMLKSGGPPMTVEGIEQTNGFNRGWIRCHWADATGTHEKLFPAIVLKPVTTEGPQS
jgi:uncharacterized protein YodC (DUF2158 family)